MTATLIPLLAVGIPVVVTLWVLTVWRPAIGCALLVLGIPLTGGLARGSLIPLLRVNEALLLVVVSALLVRELPRRHRFTFTGLDVVVFAFSVGGVLVPWAVLSLQHADTTLDDWRSVLAPIQYLLVYLVFSRVAFLEGEVRLLLNLALLASLIVALVALAELANVPGVRDVIANYFPPLATAPGTVTDTQPRPSSLLGHYSAV
jgi:hypothetical protein